MIDAEQVHASLAANGISFKESFFTLSRLQVEALLTEADRCGYRKPKHANGSRGRYFYAAVQRKLNRQA